MKKIVFTFLCALITCTQFYSQNTNDMNFKEIVDSIKANYVFVYLEFNNNMKLDVYYSIDDDTICLVDEVKQEVIEFDEYLKFSDYLYSNYEFELDFENKYNEVKKFRTSYLRHNLCLNKPFLLNLEDSIEKYLKKFNSLFDVDVSPYKKIPEDGLEKINKAMQNIIENNFSKIPQYELPILVFVGEYFRNKYNSEWEFADASNDFGNNFIIPYIKVNGEDLELSRKIYRYLNHPNLKYGEKKFRFDYFLDLDFIVTQSSINIKKQE